MRLLGLSGLSAEVMGFAVVMELVAMVGFAVALELVEY